MLTAPFHTGQYETQFLYFQCFFTGESFLHAVKPTVEMFSQVLLSYNFWK